MYENRDELFIMQEDLDRALQDPAPNWAMLFDLRRCTACRSCTAACISEHKSPPGMIYRPVYEEESGTFPQVQRRFTPRPCNQCDNPPCVAACPKAGTATWKSTSGPSTGIVMIDYSRCAKCGKCVVACPYKARALDGGGYYTQGTPQLQEYETSPAFEYDQHWARPASFTGTVRKCHFCFHRIKRGMLPACVSTCTCRAAFFGNLTDPQSLISKMLALNSGAVKVLSSVEPAVPPPRISNLTPAQISAAIGYPGTAPIFADSAATSPRVMYILP